MQQSVTSANRPGQAKVRQGNARDNMWMIVRTPIQHLSIMNYICARKCEKLATLMMRHTKIMAWELTCKSRYHCPPMPSYAVPVFVNARVCPTKDILIYPFSFSGPDYRYDGGSIYARKMAAKAARPAMAIELPVVLAAPLKA